MLPHAGRERIYLASIPASRSHKTLAFAVVAVSLAIFTVCVIFVHTRLPHLPAFVPAYESALLLTELIASLLLVSQFLRSGSPAMLLLSCGYLYNALIIIPHLLTFPNVFAPTGLLGAGPQTTAWLYVFWHAGFPIAVIAAFLVPAGRPATLVPAQLRLWIAGAFAAVATLVVLLTALATAGVEFLTPIMNGTDYSMLVTKGISPFLIALCVVALAIGLRKKDKSVLDVWIMVVMVVYVLDIAMSAVLGVERFDLGWYAGRAFGLGAGTFVMAVLLWESNGLYVKLVQALEFADRQNEQLLRSRADLARVQRLEAMGQLTGGVAHDFNNALQIISANLNLARLKLPIDHAVQERLARALDGVKQGARLSSELLSFARKQPLRPEVMNISDLLTNMNEMLRRTLGEEIEIETRVQDGLWNMLVDSALLEAALLNLALNARDAMGGAGIMTIGACNISVGAGSFTESGETIESGEYVMISVSDRGSGIDPKILPNVFEPFFTTKAFGTGTGLGLSMVFGFVKQSSGYVKIVTELGHGTTIELYLPRSLETSDAAAPRESGVLSRGSERILVVEDDDGVRASTVGTLEELGYRVFAAANASDALHKFEAGLVVDILFTDVIMPGPVKTTEMVARARERLPKMEVIYTSGYAEDAIVHGGRLDAGVRLISKPYRTEELAAMLRQAIAS